MTAAKVKKVLKSYVDREKASILSRFFKTGKGEYGEGDCFLGITVPHQRKVAKQFVDLDFSQVQKLLESKYHEERLTGLLILTYQFEKGAENDKERIAKFYKKNLRYVNNWDLVDVTTPKILGEYYFTRKRDDLYKWVKSKNLWYRRISILVTFYFIKQGEFEETLKLVEILLNDSEDLIHKSSGWMLREIGKKDRTVLEGFLKKHYKRMPRTMLRYSIEKFSQRQREAYLKGRV